MAKEMSSANLQAIYVLWLRQMKRFIRSRSRLVANIVQPFFFLAILGFGYSSFRLFGDLAYIDLLDPGIVTMSVVFSSIFAGV